MSTLTLAASVMLACSQTSSPFTPGSPDEQLFPTRILAALQGGSKGDRRLIWPTSTQARFVKRDLMPQPVVTNASEWIKRIVKLALPSTIESNFVGLRSHIFKDAVALRFSLNSIKVQIVDSPSVIDVTIQDPKFKFDGLEDEQSVLGVIRDALRVPAGSVKEAQLYLVAQKAPDGSEYLVGSVEIERNGKSAGWLSWWNRFWIVAGDSTIAFTFTKTLGDGIVGTDKGPQPLKAGRFGNID